jgi:L-iditol 2-dehydrogenase
LVFSGDLPVQQLISDRVPLDEIERGIGIAQSPTERSLKVVVHPQETI